VGSVDPGVVTECDCGFGVVPAPATCRPRSSEAEIRAPLFPPVVVVGVGIRPRSRLALNPTSGPQPPGAAVAGRGGICPGDTLEEPIGDAAAPPPTSPISALTKPRFRFTPTRVLLPDPVDAEIAIEEDLGMVTVLIV
jgi:hypothetical protein